MNQPRTQRISAAFGNAAPRYEEHAGVQRIVAAALAGLLRQQPLPAFTAMDASPRILEIGCGTGMLTRHLRSLFPHAEIVATDISPEMIAIAGARGDAGARFMQMDGEVPDFDGPYFDLIASSLTFQWFTDLSSALDRLCGLLRPGGSLMFATMAQRSFHEWREAHQACGLQAGTPRYPTAQELRDMLARHSDAFLFEEDYRYDFGGARGLLAHLKGIGATVPVEGREPLSPKEMRAVMRAFNKAGGECTYHVAYCRVTKLD